MSSKMWRLPPRSSTRRLNRAGFIAIVCMQVFLGVPFIATLTLFIEPGKGELALTLASALRAVNTLDRGIAPGYK
jgi:hypothetical protein